MKDRLIAVGSNDLFGCPLAGTTRRPPTTSEATTRHAPRYAEEATKRGGQPGRNEPLNRQRAARRARAASLAFMFQSRREQPNARHHPPRTQRDYGQALRMKATLFAVGCMPL
jgi:hypothetical protein